MREKERRQLFGLTLSSIIDTTAASIENTENIEMINQWHTSVWSTTQVLQSQSENISWHQASRKSKRYLRD